MQFPFAVRGFFGAALFALLFAMPAVADDGERLRVAVIGNARPMSYADADGRLAGFNIEFAQALCDAMKARCELLPVPFAQVIDAIASGQHDLAAVSLLATPERRQKVLFSKPYYRTVSVLLTRSAATDPDAGMRIAAVHGSEQEHYAERQGWKVHPVATHGDLATVLATRVADAAVVPMLTALVLMRDERVSQLALTPRVLSDLAVDVCLAIDPRQPELRDRVDAAIDRVKSDGRFDRINSRYLPFRLQ